MQLIQTVNNKVMIHAVDNRVSPLIDFYYRYRRQFGYMEVIDESTGKVLATLSSKKDK